MKLIYFSGCRGLSKSRFNSPGPVSAEEASLDRRSGCRRGATVELEHSPSQERRRSRHQKSLAHSENSASRSNSGSVRTHVVPVHRDLASGRPRASAFPQRGVVAGQISCSEFVPESPRRHPAEVGGVLPGCWRYGGARPASPSYSLSASVRRCSGVVSATSLPVLLSSPSPAR